MKNLIAAVLFAIFLICFAPIPGFCSAIFGPPKSSDAAVAEAPKDALGRETPRGTLSGFIDAIRKDDFDRAASYLNLSYLTKTQAAAQGPKLARSLETLLDSGAQLTPISILSNEVEGNENDGLSEGLERLGTLVGNGESADLVAERITGKDGISIWLISTETMRKVPKLVKNVKSPPIDRLLPKTLLEHKVAGAPVGHWLAMLTLAGLAYLLAFLAVRSVLVLLRRCWKRHETDTRHVVDAFELPVRLYLAVWAYVFAVQKTGISIVARQDLSRPVIIVAWISLALFLWKLIDVVAEASEKKLIARGKYGALSGVQFFRRMAKFFFLAIALFVSLDTIGIDVTAALAALGIGGIALAFGAQKTVENFIGSIMVIFDQPVRIGDFCKVGDIMGTIEDIGMRSTRIRTLERTIVTIPNGDFSSQRIDNFAHRDRMRLYTKLFLRLDTSPDQIRYLLVEIRAMLFAHPRMDASTANTRLVGWTQDALEIEVTGAVPTANFDDFMEVREDIYLRVLEIVRNAGAVLAMPVPTGLPGSGESDPAREEFRTKAERQVRDWIAGGRLQLPKFDPEEIARLKNSLDYPPRGAAGAKN
jgi:MscS family membrane protein